MKKMTMLMPSWASVLFSTSFNVGHSCRLNYTFREHKSKMLHILPKQEPQKKKKSVFLVRKKNHQGGHVLLVLITYNPKQKYIR